MEQGNLTRMDLEPLIGSRGRVAEVFSGRRSLSLAMIRKLHEELQIPLESLILSPKRSKKAAPKARAKLHS
jgi:HTH-type transcriptional regulator/antitoxin HigA